MIDALFLGNISIQKRLVDYTKYLDFYDEKIIIKHHNHPVPISEEHNALIKINHNYYLKQLYKFLSFEFGSHSYMRKEILIFDSVDKHNDKYFAKDINNDKIYFLNVMLKGSGELQFYQEENDIFPFKSYEIEKGDVVLFDPTITHKFINHSKNYCQMYALCVKNIKFI